MHEKDVRPSNILVIFVLLTTNVNFPYRPLLQLFGSPNAYLKDDIFKSKVNKSSDSAMDRKIFEGFFPYISESGHLGHVTRTI